MTGACETPMSDHVAKFWQTIATEYVRILIDIRRDHDEGQPPHWDSVSFSNEVAKALVANHATAQTDLLSRDELSRYFRTEEYADEIADIISNFPPAEHVPTPAHERVWRGSGHLEDTGYIDKQERCPTCRMTDEGYKRNLSWAGCTDPWHGDDHLRKVTP